MSFDGLHLLRPEALWLLLLLPVVGLLLWRQVAASGSWSKAIDPDLLPFMLETEHTPSKRRGHWWLLLGLALAVLAIAGPSFNRIDVPVFQRADALVVVLDLSASMQAADVQPSRAQRARQKILDLLEQRDEGVTGLVVYAGDAHVVAPLTDDRRTIENLLPALQPSIMPLPGSDAAAALELAASLLGAAGVANGQILLMTDGMPKFDPSDVRGTLEAANAELAILGIGTESGAPIPRSGGGFMRSSDGEIVIPTLDVGRLQDIASELGGQYADISLDNSDIDRLTQIALDVDAGEIQLDRQTDTWLDQGNWLALVIALGLLPLFRRGALALLLLVPLLTGSPPAAAQNFWQTPDQQGAQSLAAGDAAAAAELFENSEWRGTAHYQAGDWDAAARDFASVETADGHYNRGNALAMQGDYAGALAAYEQSLSLAPEQADAEHNRDLMQRLLEQQQQQEQQGEGEEGNDQEQQDGENGQQGESQNSSEDQQQNQQADQNQSNDQSQGNQSDDGQSGNAPEDQAPSDTPSEQRSDQSSQGQSPEFEQSLAEQTEQQMAKFDEALEKQQALEQWLRRVPDDPGGLLQRKFRYESIQRLRRGEEPDDEIRW